MCWCCRMYGGPHDDQRTVIDNVAIGHPPLVYPALEWLPKQCCRRTLLPLGSRTPKPWSVTLVMECTDMPPSTTQCCTLPAPGCGWI